MIGITPFCGYCYRVSVLSIFIKLIPIFQILFVITTWAVTTNVVAGESYNPHKRVMFIGNSFSYYNNGLQNHLAGLVRSANEWSRSHRYRLSTLSGGRLYEHTEQLRNSMRSEKIKWDSVVLQPQSNEAIVKARVDSFNLALSEQVEIIRKAGSEPLLFMTWAYKSSGDMHQRLEQAYLDAGTKYNLRLIPVGIAFHQVKKQLPNIDLYVADILSIDSKGALTYKADIKHPSWAGTYLAACVFYAALYRKSPENLPYTGGLNLPLANQLQRIAWQTVEHFDAM